MSINYHAYQCRNYLLSGFEEIKKQWEADFAGFDPERIKALLSLTGDDTWLYLNYLNTPFRLNLKDGHLEKKIKDGVVEEDPLTFLPYEPGFTGNVGFNEAMTVYHLLKFTADFPRTGGSWIPNEALDPRARRNDPHEKLLLTEFAAFFSERMEALDAACKKAGGRPFSSKADLSYEFYPFPQTPMRLLFWDGDDEFPAQVQLLVYDHITDYVHLETTGCMVSDLFDKLEKIDKGEYDA